MQKPHAPQMYQAVVSQSGSLVPDHSLLQQPIVRFPSLKDFADQDSEWCEVYDEGAWRRLRLHDYHEIYRQPGLYEQLFANLLRCQSPERVVGLLSDVLKDEGEQMTSLVVLDVGAGNGLVGEEYRKHGARGLIGLDIVPEAGEAAERDRPGLYDCYITADLCQLPAHDFELLQDARINTLSTVSALGFGDIPVRAFARALSFVEQNGWLAFNIKESFLAGEDATGFSRLIRSMSETGVIRIEAYRRYTHRLSVDGRSLKYVAMVARKLSDPSESLVADASSYGGTVEAHCLQPERITRPPIKRKSLKSWGVKIPEKVS